MLIKHIWEKILVNKSFLFFIKSFILCFLSFKIIFTSANVLSILHIYLDYRDYNFFHITSSIFYFLKSLNPSLKIFLLNNRSSHHNNYHHNNYHRNNHHNSHHNSRRNSHHMNPHDLNYHPENHFWHYMR